MLVEFVTVGFVMIRSGDDACRELELLKAGLNATRWLGGVSRS